MTCSSVGMSFPVATTSLEQKHRFLTMKIMDEDRTFTQP